MKFLFFLSLLIASGATAEAPRRIWIDTDAACGVGMLSDVDDCLAIALLMRDPSLDIVGISTVFGNASIAGTDRTVRRLVETWCRDCLPVYLGAEGSKSTSTAASRAIAAALKREPLTVFVFGPASNVSTALKAIKGPLHPHKFVAVAGTRRKVAKFRVSGCSPFKFPDLNYEKDPAAFDYLLERGVDLTLMPFELAQQVTLRGSHIKKVSVEYPQLGAEAHRWRRIWRLFLGKNGFHPFDAVGVSFLRPEEAGLLCSEGTAGSVLLGQRNPRKILYVSMSQEKGNVTYCHGIDTNYADIIARRLETLSEPNDYSVK